MKDFTRKVIIITGSSTSIGKHLARQLLAAGATVVLNGRNPRRLQRTVAEFKIDDSAVIGIPGDVYQLEDCRQIVEGGLYGRRNARYSAPPEFSAYLQRYASEISFCRFTKRPDSPIIFRGQDSGRSRWRFFRVFTDKNTNLTQSTLPDHSYLNQYPSETG